MIMKKYYCDACKRELKQGSIPLAYLTIAFTQTPEAKRIKAGYHGMTQKYDMFCDDCIYKLFQATMEKLELERRVVDE